ncbi:MAG: CHAT domain-containing protein [Cytophagia bacterium]|nr:MAG: CHAT domain-containing protein [Runella sp.]TAG21329.1 MAG: CHAT domain-containing protein [Cytophagales bacterium]TAG40713.1 MAG: CHAT domain-containing protein [Cytophagia bacterium]TAG82090.1 MAG: CHAT domain-containing protein [Cytophagales bacterium]
MTARSLLLIIISFLYVQVGQGQCPDRLAFAQQIKQTQEMPDAQAIASLKKIQVAWQKCYPQNDSTFAYLLHLLGRRHWLQARESPNPSELAFKTAERYTLAAIQINQQQLPQVSRANLVNSYLNAGILNYEHLNQKQLAFGYFTKCVEIAKIYPYKRSLGTEASYYLTQHYDDKGDYIKSLEWAAFTLKWSQEAKDSYNEIWALNQIIRCNLILQRFDEAKRILKQQIAVINKSGNEESLGLAYLKLASLAYNENNEPEMNNWFSKALAIYEKQKNRNQTTTTLLNWGYSLIKNPKNHVLAEQKLKQAFQLSQSISSKVRVLDNLGSLKKKQHKFQEALQIYQEAIETYLPSLSKRKMLNPSAVSVKSISKSDYLLEVIQGKADTWLDYSKAPQGGKGALQNALKTYALADSMIDFMRYEHAGEGSKLFWRQKTRGMYERAIEATYLAGDSEMAFRFFEKSKAVLLADKLNELGANQQLSEADTRRQRALRDSIANLQNQLAALPTTDKKRQVLQTRLERFNDDFAAFRKNLETTNPAYYRYKYDNSTPSFHNLSLPSSFLGEGSFVSYFVGDSAVYGLVIQNQAKLIRLKIQPADYQKLANEFLNLCANRAALNAQYPRYRALGYALYEQLWKPLHINTERVVIAQDGAFLPFEAFLTAPEGNEFLLKRHAISYTYSAKYLQPPTPRRGSLNINSFVGFAPETFAVGLKQVPLSGSAAVLQEVGQDFWFGKKLVNAEASKDNFLRHAPNARVIQLFTHAEADSTEATEPKIYFQDAALRLSELNQTEGFAAQLLVLSACKTGVGANQRGEGVFSLARGFAALGIPSTITTLWSVEDQPTYELTKLFYRYLHQDLPKDVALQRAKLDWLAAGGAADALPSEWAGMILVGDAAPLTSTFSISIIGLVIPTIGWAAIAGILLLLAAFGWWRRRRLS